MQQLSVCVDLQTFMACSAHNTAQNRQAGPRAQMGHFFFPFIQTYLSQKKMEEKELILRLPRQLKLSRTVGFRESQASLLGGKAASLILAPLGSHFPVGQGRGSHPFPVELSISSCFMKGHLGSYGERGMVRGAMLFCDRPHVRDQSFL